MAISAFSTLLDWQLEETKISNINSGALDVGISSTYFYSHLLPSDKFGSQCFSFVKWEQGGTSEKDNFYYKMNDADLPSQAWPIGNLSRDLHIPFPGHAQNLLLKVSGGPAHALGEGTEAKAWPCMSVSLQTSFLLWSRNGKHTQNRSGFHQPVIYSVGFTPWIIHTHACSFRRSQCSAALPPHLSNESVCFTLP